MLEKTKRIMGVLHEKLPHILKETVLLLLMTMGLMVIVTMMILLVVRVAMMTLLIVRGVIMMSVDRSVR